jgi:hypothetical protein
MHNRTVFLNPKSGTATYAACRELHTKAQVIDNLEAFVDVECIKTPKLYVFPRAHQSVDDCKTMHRKLLGTIQNVQLFIVQYEVQPLQEQVPMLLRRHAE